MVWAAAVPVEMRINRGVRCSLEKLLSNCLWVGAKGNLGF